MTFLRATCLSSFTLFAASACGGTSNPPVTTPSAASATTLATAPTSSAPPTPAVPMLASHDVPLPGATGVVLMDYLAADRAANRVWVPAGGLGSVVVIDGGTLAASHVDGFTTSELEIRGHKYMIGPSAVALGGGVAFVGNRGDATICAIDAAAMKTGACYPLAHGSEMTESADGMAYVAATKELWVTLGAATIGFAPQPDASVVILDATNPQKLTKTGKVKLGGSAEGYAVDDAHGVFYTNLEEANQTLAIDIKTRKVTSKWSPGCDNEGPRGLAVDPDRGFVMVACTNGVRVLDAGHGGAVLSKMDTGGGVDNIDYVPQKHQLFVAAADDGRLSVINVDDHGAMTKLATGRIGKGSRVVVADAQGRAYVADSGDGKIIVFDAVP
jgi:DNA-binding beta-propeller fold protein YncE